MKFIALMISIAILAVPPVNFNMINANVFVGHVNDHASIMLEYNGNCKILEQYFSKFHVSIFGYERHYLLNGNWMEVSKSLNLKNNSAYLPYYIAKDIVGIISGKSVKTNIEYASDPYNVNYIINAYGVGTFLKNGVNGTGYRAVIVVPYGDPDLMKNFYAFNEMNHLENGNIFIKYFISDPQRTEQNWTTETDLDVEMLHAFAPGANITVAVSPNDNSTTLEIVLLKVINERLGNVISLSWGGPENEIYDPFFHYVLKRAAMLGITVIASAGDTPDVEYPASDTYVLSIGGTTLLINGTMYSRELLWESSGGGFSKIFPRPTWQIGPGYYTSAGRGVPDISLDGNPETGVFIYSNGEIAVGGTSMSAPMFAGMLLDLEQKERNTFGFFTPELYYLNSVNGQKYFNHIYLKNNFTYGWHTQTGLGSPKIYNWSFPEKTFTTAVNIGNFSNVSALSFYVRGYTGETYHRNETNLFYVQMKSGNEQLSVGFSQTSKKFYYSFASIRYFNSAVLNDELYHIFLHFYRNETSVLINGNNFSIPVFHNNFSVQVFAKSTGNFSFYTNLGPVEFRGFEIIQEDGNRIVPYYIKSITVQIPVAYGAMEIPFLKNDFLIGAIGIPGEQILWPRSFSYVKSEGINGNFIINIPNLVGTGTSEDPYIISGLEVNSTNAGFIYNGNKYFIFNHCIINAPVGIILFGGNLKIIDSVINSSIGIEAYFTVITVLNSSFHGIIGINAPFSSIFSFGNMFFNIYSEFIMLQIIGGSLLYDHILIVSAISVYIIKREKDRKI